MDGFQSIFFKLCGEKEIYNNVGSDRMCTGKIYFKRIKSRKYELDKSEKCISIFAQRLESLDQTVETKPPKPSWSPPDVVFIIFQRPNKETRQQQQLHNNSRLTSGWPVPFSGRGI